MKKITILFAFLMTFTLQAQLMRPSQFTLAATDSVYSGLIGSSISDLAGVGDTIWLGSGHGLSASFDNGDSYVGYSRRFSDLGQGGVSALTVRGDTIWIATGYDTTIAGENLKVGGGISRSLDGGNSWTLLGQPMDSLRRDSSGLAATYSEIDLWGVSILAVDVVTPIQNITYDLAFDGKRLWATSFGGGVRVSHDYGDTWERVMLPWDELNILDSTALKNIESDIIDNPEYYAQDGVQHLNHVAFSVKAWGDTVWVGTAAGANRSVDGGKSWTHYSFQNSNLSGNWVIALNRQVLEDGSERIWASSITTGDGDVTGISFFESDLNYWRVPLRGQKSWNFDSDKNTIYAATDDGLWKSKDGLHFILLPNFQNSDRSETVYSEEVYAVLINNDGAVWVGTGDGLAVSYNDGLTWNIHKARSTADGDEFYAYPNPFTPRYDKVLNGQGNLIIRFLAEAGDELSISVFDFAMHRVKQVREDYAAPFSGPQELTWNGRNELGYLVSNGTYFIRMENGSEISWTKVMVIN
jgi:hypothetical protein